MDEYLNKQGLTKLWNKIDNQNTKIVEFIKNIKSNFAQPSDDTPAELDDVPAAGNSNKFSRADHVHLMPTYEDVGAAPYRKCLIEGYSETEEEKIWRIFADSYVDNGSTSITFLVRKTKTNNCVGILTATIKLNSGAVEEKDLKWILLDGDIDVQDFGLSCEGNENTLAVNCKKDENYIFEVLEEHNNFNDKESSWNLYDKKASENDDVFSSSEITYSTLEDIHNNCATADKLSKIVTINDVDFDGSANIRLKNSFNYEFGTHSQNRYTTFCKIPVAASETSPLNSVSLIITDVAKYQYMIGGVWFVQAGVHSGVITMEVVELVTPKANGTKFGYYKQDDKYCLAAYRGSDSGTFNITVLKQGKSTIEKEDWTTAQGGDTWKEIPISKVLTNSNFEEYYLKERENLNKDFFNLKVKTVASAAVDENGIITVDLPNSIIVDIQSDKYDSYPVKFEHWQDSNNLIIKPYNTNTKSEITSSNLTNLNIYYMGKEGE